ncbi:MAG: ADP-ribosylglycohydrolase family protein [Muribaculum sp.]|nr:ADP-ribosylglycohydrolase family protein [Muribaculum sp.]
MNKVLDQNSKQNLKEKIRGCLFGYAIGDALGKGTELMTAQEAAVKYPSGLHHYNQIIRDAHRSHWAKNDFTLDTEWLLILLDSIKEDGYSSPEGYARKLRQMYEANPFDMEGRLRVVISHPDFLQKPMEVARSAWNRSGRLEAYNECLGRAMVLGTSLTDYARKATDNCKITHYDPRCVTSSVVIAHVAHDLLWGNGDISIDFLIEICKSLDERAVPFVDTAANGSLQDFDLDDRDTYWWARKTMGSALWCLWHCSSPLEALDMLVAEAGDADTNAALALGLLGLKMGYKALPADLAEDLLQYDRLENAASLWVNLLEEFASKEYDMNLK